MKGIRVVRYKSDRAFSLAKACLKILRVLSYTMAANSTHVLLGSQIKRIKPHDRIVHPCALKKREGLRKGQSPQ